MPNPNAPLDRVQVGDVAEEIVRGWPARDGDGNPLAHIAGDELVTELRRLADPLGIDVARIDAGVVASILRDRGLKVEDL